MVEESLDAHELVAALTAGAADAKPLTIKDLPHDQLVSIFAATKDLTWVRHNVPLVCKAWNEIYCSRGASPLHETLEVDFGSEVATAAATRAREEGPLRGLRPITRAAAQEWASRRPVVHASSIISWAERRAGSVRKLDLKEGFEGALEDFSAKDLSELLAVVGSSLTHISIASEQLRGSCFLYKLLRKPFWESLRDSVVPAGQLRSLGVRGISSAVLESDVEPLAQLAGTLEELVLDVSRLCRPYGPGPPRFPEFICSLTKLRRLSVSYHSHITAIPAKISSLQKLEDLDLRNCLFSSLPKELGELSGLTRLDLAQNWDVGSTLPADEAFPAELGRMKALRELFLSFCDLRAVPAFVGALESLAILDLSDNFPLQIHAPLDFLIEGCPMLCEVRLQKESGWVPWTPESLTHLKAFKAKLLAKNPDAKVFY